MRKHANERERMRQMRRNVGSFGILLNFQQIQKEIDPEKHWLNEMPLYHRSRTSQEREGASNCRSGLSVAFVC